MADETKVYILDEAKNAYQGMTKEQIINAITSYNATGEIDVDQGFISRILELNKSGNLQFWIGTMAEYEAIETKQEDTLYLFSDDPTIDDIETAITQLQQKDISQDESLDSAVSTINQRLDELGFKEGVVQQPSSVGTWSCTLKKQGKYAIINLEASNWNYEQGVLPQYIYIQLPEGFYPKADATISLFKYGVQVYSGNYVPEYENTKFDYEGNGLLRFTRSLKSLPSNILAGVAAYNVGYEIE